MAPSISRAPIFLNLAAFLGFSVFCISTQAPLIQQDILKRCQDALLTHHIPIRGLAVDGRDVVLSGAPESAIVSHRARFAVEKVPGVRVVETRLLASPNDFPTEASGAGGHEQTSSDNNLVLEPSTIPQQQDVQDEVDRVLQNQGITFRTGTAALTPQSEVLLDKIAGYLNGTPNLLCEIRGYESAPREAGQDRTLAMQRALATGDYLQSKGVAGSRLSTRALPSSQAIASSHMDRAVDFVVKAK